MQRLANMFGKKQQSEIKIVDESNLEEKEIKNEIEKLKIEIKEESDDEKCEEEQEIEDESDQEEEIKKEKSEYGKFLCDIDGKIKGKLYEIDYIEFLKLIKNNPHNRETKKDHVDEIATGIKKYRLLFAPITIGIDDSLEPRLLDGHHRTLSLQQIYKKDKTFQLKIIIKVFRYEDHDDPEVLDFIEKLNNVRKCKQTDRPSKILSDSINKLKSHFDDMIRDKKGNQEKVNRPRVDSHLLSRGIKESKIIETYKFTAFDVKDLIIFINNKLKNKHQSYFKVPINQYEKANEENFYLGLKRDNSTFVYEWLGELDKYVKLFQKAKNE